MELLENIDIEVRCEVCGEAYGVPTSTVQASQELLERGCPLTSPESCPAAFFGALVEPAALEELQQAWAHLARSAATHGAVGPVVHAAAALRAPPSRRERRDRRTDQEALARWEGEGGAPAH